MHSEVSKNMPKSKNPYPTIGEAAKLLGVSKRQLDHLYMAGKTPTVRRDRMRRRRYPPIALQQAQRALQKGAGIPLKDDKKNVYLFSYIFGAAIAFLAQPKIISILGLSLSSLLMNFVFKVLDTQVSERYKGQKRGFIVVALRKKCGLDTPQRTRARLLDHRPIL